MALVLPEEVPRRGSAFWRAVGRAVLAAGRWRVDGEFPPLPKFVVAVAPHTSNWDFVFGAAAMFAMDLRLAFLAKHTLFVGPFGPALRWMGGIPVDRSAAHGVVAESVAGFTASGARVLVVAPEGTRSRVSRFRTGFLQIARGAGVPVVYAALDYEARTVRIGPWFDPGEDIEADRARAEAHFAPIRGRNR